MDILTSVGSTREWAWKRTHGNEQNDTDFITTKGIVWKIKRNM